MGKQGGDSNGRWRSGRDGACKKGAEVQLG